MPMPTACKSKIASGGRPSAVGWWMRKDSVPKGPMLGCAVMMQRCHALCSSKQCPALCPNRNSRWRPLLRLMVFLYRQPRVDQLNVIQLSCCTWYWHDDSCSWHRSLHICHLESARCEDTCEQVGALLATCNKVSRGRHSHSRHT